ncbi:MAG: hypothetical protein ACON4R_17030 [Akkermansiaceae bacterium]
MRADLEKLDEVAAAFVNAGSITLMMATADSYDEEEIGKMTKKRKSVIRNSTKLAKSPL